MRRLDGLLRAFGMQALWLYLAGIVEGEGCLQIRKTKSEIGNTCYSLIVTVSNKSIGLITALQEIWGGSIVADRRCSLRRGRNVCYTWKIYSRRAYDVLVGIAPYVVFRGEQIRAAIQFQDLRNRYRSNQPVAQEIIEMYEWYRLEISRLSGNGKIYRQSLTAKNETKDDLECVSQSPSSPAGSDKDGECRE